MFASMDGNIPALSVSKILSRLDRSNLPLHPQKTEHHLSYIPSFASSLANGSLVDELGE